MCVGLRIPQFYSLRRLGSSDILIARSTKQPHLDCKYHFPLKGTRTLEKWLAPGLGQGKYKRSLKHLVPGTQELLKEQGGLYWFT